jgi:hypothetical protein
MTAVFWGDLFSGGSKPRSIPRPSKGKSRTRIPDCPWSVRRSCWRDRSPSGEVSGIGSEDVLVHEVLVNTVREVVLNVEMKEAVQNLDEVKVMARRNRSEAINQMAPVSAIPKGKQGSQDLREGLRNESTRLFQDRSRGQLPEEQAVLVMDPVARHPQCDRQGKHLGRILQRRTAGNGPDRDGGTDPGTQLPRGILTAAVQIGSCSYPRNERL